MILASPTQASVFMIISTCNIVIVKKNIIKLFLAHDRWWCLTACGLIKEEVSPPTAMHCVLTKSLDMLRPGLQFELEVAKKSTALLVQASFTKKKQS